MANATKRSSENELDLARRGHFIRILEWKPECSGLGNEREMKTRRGQLYPAEL